ncbi:hypothetical protein K440DRAFT_640832 [Wilcoxina mikolae CBS 423.85]|nr:hypothetical protein K440DRAFT_640832 [Wilcoxina mikolae CBS 423.85]
MDSIKDQITASSSQTSLNDIISKPEIADTMTPQTKPAAAYDTVLTELAALNVAGCQRPTDITNAIRKSRILLPEGSARKDALVSSRLVDAGTIRHGYSIPLSRLTMLDVTWSPAQTQMLLFRRFSPPILLNPTEIRVLQHQHPTRNGEVFLDIQGMVVSSKLDIIDVEGAFSIDVLHNHYRYRLLRSFCYKWALDHSLYKFIDINRIRFHFEDGIPSPNGVTQFRTGVFDKRSYPLLEFPAIYDNSGNNIPPNKITKHAMVRILFKACVFAAIRQDKVHVSINFPLAGIVLEDNN